MQIVHFICDRCHREDLEDDAIDWSQTQDGRDLCPVCFRYTGGCGPCDCPAVHESPDSAQQDRSER